MNRSLWLTVMSLKIHENHYVTNKKTCDFNLKHNILKQLSSIINIWSDSSALYISFQIPSCITSHAGLFCVKLSIPKPVIWVPLTSNTFNGKAAANLDKQSSVTSVLARQRLSILPESLASIGPRHMERTPRSVILPLDSDCEGAAIWIFEVLPKYKCVTFGKRPKQVTSLSPTEKRVCKFVCFVWDKNRVKITKSISKVNVGRVLKTKSCG